MAGLLCGVVWESLNFFAPQKWIYTVRGLENLKLFEMPVLGFFGFPALAYDAIAGFSLMAYLFLGNETWEHPSDVSYPLAPRPRPPRWILWSTIPLQVGAWAIVLLAVQEVNLGSLQLELSDFELTVAERAGRAPRTREPARMARQP